MAAHTPVPSYRITDGPRWTVPSNSAKNLTYTVTVDPHTQLYVCGCKDHQFRHRDCRHIKQVQAGQAGKPRIRIEPKSATSHGGRLESRQTSPNLPVDGLYGDAGAAATRSVAQLRAVS